jgi:hypothetical protein
MRASLAVTRNIVRELKTAGTYGYAATAMPPDEVKELMR